MARFSPDVCDATLQVRSQPRCSAFDVGGSETRSGKKKECRAPQTRMLAIGCTPQHFDSASGSADFYGADWYLWQQTLQSQMNMNKEMMFGVPPVLMFGPDMRPLLLPFPQAMGPRSRHVRARSACLKTSLNSGSACFCAN